MKACFEKQRVEHYKLISQQPVHPEMKNTLRNLVDNWIDSAVSAQAQRASLHRWSDYLQRVRALVSSDIPF